VRRRRKRSKHSGVIDSQLLTLNKIRESLETAKHAAPHTKERLEQAARAFFNNLDLPK